MTKIELEKSAYGLATAHFICGLSGHDEWYPAYLRIESAVDDDNLDDLNEFEVWAPFENDTWESVLADIDDLAQSIVTEYQYLLGTDKEADDE